MTTLISLGTYFVPLLAAMIIVSGLIKKQPVFDVFALGAKDGIKTAFKILPSIIGLVTAVEMFKASGALDLISRLLSPVGGLLGIPEPVLPLALIHPVSGSGATAVLTSIFETSGPDSFAGRVASVICGSGETTFYAIMIYFGSTSVKKIRHTVFVALAADFTAMIASAAAVKWFFGA